MAALQNYALTKGMSVKLAKMAFASQLPIRIVSFSGFDKQNRFDQAFTDYYTVLFDWHDQLFSRSVSI